MAFLRSSRRFSIWLLLPLLLAFSYCQLHVSDDEQQAAARLPSGDTATVTSFHAKLEDSPALANWGKFATGREMVCVPPGWTYHLAQDSIELVLLPPGAPDSTERVTFTRWAKDGPSRDYQAVARQLATSAFSGFGLAEADTLNQLVFPHDFAVERNAGLRTQGQAYRAYCLVYVDDKNVYRLRIILAQARLKGYRGDLLRDIIGNVQIDRKYFVEHANQLKQIIRLR